MKPLKEMSISADAAWRVFRAWQLTRREIGVIFYSGSGTSVYTCAWVKSVGNGILRLKGKSLSASFRLVDASFTHGTLPVWPRWPAAPMIGVRALRAKLENGDGLLLAEGLYSKSLPPHALTK